MIKFLTKFPGEVHQPKQHPSNVQICCPSCVWPSCALTQGVRSSQQLHKRSPIAVGSPLASCFRNIHQTPMLPLEKMARSGCQHTLSWIHGKTNHHIHYHLLVPKARQRHGFVSRQRCALCTSHQDPPNLLQSLSRKAELLRWWWPHLHEPLRGWSK